MHKLVNFQVNRLQSVCVCRTLLNIACHMMISSESGVICLMSVREMCLNVFCKYNFIGIASVSTHAKMQNCIGPINGVSFSSTTSILKIAYHSLIDHFKWTHKIINPQCFFIDANGICKLKCLSNDIIYKWPPHMMVMVIKRYEKKNTLKSSTTH